MPFPIEMIMATKEIRTALNASKVYDDHFHSDLPIRAATASYTALRDVIVDPCFRSVVESVQRTTEETRTEFDQILASRKAFQHVLNNETTLLYSAGADDALITLLLNLTRTMHEQQRIKALQMEELYQSLMRLRDEVATIRADLQVNQEMRKPAKRGWRKRIQDTVIGIGGVALVGLNVSAAAATLGLGLAGMAVSGAIGNALVSYSLEQFLTEEVKEAQAHNTFNGALAEAPHRAQR
jgi:hypothetical protein